MLRQFLNELAHLPKTNEIQIPMQVFVKQKNNDFVDKGEEGFFTKLHELIEEKQPNIIKLNDLSVISKLDEIQLSAVIRKALCFLLILPVEHIKIDFSAIKEHQTNFSSDFTDAISTIEEHLKYEYLTQAEQTLTETDFNLPEIKFIGISNRHVLFDKPAPNTPNTAGDYVPSSCKL